MKAVTIRMVTHAPQEVLKVEFPLYVRFTG